jgi:hypothetical protein
MFDDRRNGVVPFREYRSDMRFPAISEVRAYWDALRDGRVAPYRSEVDPRGIERSLEHAFVLERIAPQAARFRLAGMHLTDLMGMEVRGMPFSTFFTPAARAEIGIILENVFSGPRTADLTIAAESCLGRPALRGRIVLLPLRSDLGEVSRALGCLVTEGPIGRTPRRFEVRESLATPIAATVSDTATPVAARPAFPPARGFAEPALPFAGAAERPARGRAQLRLVARDE